MDKQLQLWANDSPIDNAPRSSAASELASNAPQTIDTASNEPLGLHVASDPVRKRCETSEPPRAMHAASNEPHDAPEPPRLITSGVIARELRQPLHRVRWVLDTRPDIRPAAYAGIIRLFTRAAIARVRYELNAIDANRSTHGDAKQ